MEKRTCEKPSNSRKRFMPAIAISLCGLTGLAVSQGHNLDALNRVMHAQFNQSDTEKDVSAFVSDIAGESVDVNCDLNANMTGVTYGAKGYVMPFGILDKHYMPSVMTVTESICDSLQDIKHTKRVTASSTQALLTAMHEYQHIADNDTDEARVACRSTATFGRALLRATTLNPETAYNVAVNTARVAYITHGATYKNDDKCRPGGEYVLDLNELGTTPLVYFNAAELGLPSN